MPLTAQEAFKVGFLGRCVEAGLSPTQTVEAVKRAADLMEKRAFFGEKLLGTALGKTVDVGKGVASGLLGYGLPLAAIAPPVVGGLAGYGLAKATDIDDTDVQEIKDRELADELRRQAARLRRQKAVRDFRHANQPTTRRLLM